MTAGEVVWEFSYVTARTAHFCFPHMISGPQLSSPIYVQSKCSELPFPLRTPAPLRIGCWSAEVPYMAIP